MNKIKAKINLLKEGLMTEETISKMQKDCFDFIVSKPFADDDTVEEWAKSKGYDIYAIRTILYKFATQYARLMIEGKGYRQGLKEKDVRQDQLLKGIKVEMEHTDCPAVAKKIAMDHLAEFDNYYDALEKMEKALEKNKVSENKVNEEKTSLHCQECGAKFSKTIGNHEITCPKCGSVDVDIDYTKMDKQPIGKNPLLKLKGKKSPEGKQYIVLKKGTRLKLKSGKIWTLETETIADGKYVYAYTSKGKIGRAEYKLD